MAKETPAVKTRKTREAKYNRTQLTAIQVSLVLNGLNALENASKDELEAIKVSAPKIYAKEVSELAQIGALRTLLADAKFVSYSTPIAKEVANSATA